MMMMVMRGTVVQQVVVSGRRILVRKIVTLVTVDGVQAADVAVSSIQYNPCSRGGGNRL